MNQGHRKSRSRLLGRSALIALLVAACSTQESPRPAPPRAPDIADHALALATAPSVPGAAAVRAAQQSVRLNSQRSDGWLALGRAWARVARETGDPGFTLAVEACAQEVLAREPASAQALGLLALALTSQHRFTDARDQARAALQSDPDDLLALGILADTLIELGDLDGAESATQRMLDLKPSLPAYARAAHLRWLRGDPPGAKVLYRHAIDSGWDARDREPTAWALVQAAMVFWNEGDYAGAEAGCDLALRWLDDYPAGLACKGRAALSAGRASEAATLLARSLKAAPLVETAWLLANARREAGDEAGAAAADADALRIGRAADGLQLAALLASRGLYLDQALRHLEEERRTRGGGALDDALAWALYRAGRIQEAEVAAERALRPGTRDARLLYHAGAIALAAGRTEHGRGLVAEALALNPVFDTVEAREAWDLLRAHR